MPDELQATINSILILIVGGALGWLGQWVVPRIRKMRDRVEVLSIQATAAQTDAQTTKLKVETQTEQFEFYKGQIDWLTSRVADLQTIVWMQEKRLKVSEAQNVELGAKYAELEVRYTSLESHVDDLYSSIAQEADGGTGILGRLKTKRPNSGNSGNSAKGGTK